MADESSCKQSYGGFIRSATSQNQVLFHEFKEGNVSKQNENASVTIDLRSPPLIHLFSSETGNAEWNKSISTGLSEYPQASAVLPYHGRYTRPQMARRGGHFHHHSARCYSKSDHANNKVLDAQGNASSCYDGSSLCVVKNSSGSFNSVSSDGNLKSRDAVAFHDRPGSCLEPKASAGSTGFQAKSSANVINVTMLGISSPQDRNSLDISKAAASDDDDGLKPEGIFLSNQPSTIIHLKLVTPSGAEQGESADPPNELSLFEESHILNEALKPAGIADAEFNAAKKGISKNIEGSLDDDSAGDSNDDDDLPLIVHCKKRTKEHISSDEESRETMKHKIKRTYERTQNSTSGNMAVCEDQQCKGKHGHACGTFEGRGKVGNVMEYTSGPQGMLSRSGSSDPRHGQKILLEEYERNRQALRNATGPRFPPTKKTKVNIKSSCDGEGSRKVIAKRSGFQAKKFPTGMKKARVITGLLPGPISCKRMEMKRLGINPRTMSHIIRELTEKKIRIGREAMTFRCISHQNYYDGRLVIRFTRNLPAKEKVMVHVPVGCNDDLEFVGKEALVLWKLSDGDVDELRKQIKQEMQHKRTEHIMPVVLQMSYEQIETAYEQVKKDMKTYEITEADTDEDEDEELEKDENEDDEEVTNEGRKVRENELENEADDNLRVRSYDIIVHDESSKTVSCETVKYLEWRKKHSKLENGTKEMQEKEAVDKNVTDMDSGGENYKPADSPGDVVQQTNYCRSRPKRHAVDYSPNAFAPIRLMEGKRLGGSKATPMKYHNKKVTGKTFPEKSQTAQRGKQSSAAVINTSEEISVTIDVAKDPVNKTNGSNIDTSDTTGNKSDTEERIPLGDGLQKLPEDSSDHQQTTCSDRLGDNLAESESLSKQDNNGTETTSDDEVPVILDVSEAPLSPASCSPSASEKLSSDSIRSDTPDRLPSAYEAVRKEYVRLRGLSDGDDESSQEKFHDDLHRSKMRNSNVDTQPVVVKTSGALDAQDGGRNLTKMPELQRQGADIWESEADGLYAPPELDLPAENQNLRQHSMSPVQPPVLEVEEETMRAEKGSSDTIEPSFALAGEVVDARLFVSSLDSTTRDHR